MTGGDNSIAAAQAFTWGQHDASNGVSADMLRNLHDLLFAVQLDGQRFIDFRAACRRQTQRRQLVRAPVLQRLSVP